RFSASAARKKSRVSNGIVRVVVVIIQPSSLVARTTIPPCEQLVRDGRALGNQDRDIMLVNAHEGMTGQRRRVVSKRPNDILRHRISVNPTKRPIDETGLSDGARGGIGLHGGHHARAADPSALR
ncbi:MAG: hypothetical protein ACTHQE_17820, partial [Thermomicrobiales bacterium]